MVLVTKSKYFLASNRHLSTLISEETSISISLSAAMRFVISSNAEIAGKCFDDFEPARKHEIGEY